VTSGIINFMEMTPTAFTQSGRIKQKIREKFFIKPKWTGI
jgi:hypothetical protein